jgi:hypothetical protein
MKRYFVVKLMELKREAIMILNMINKEYRGRFFVRLLRKVGDAIMIFKVISKCSNSVSE